MQRNVKRLLLGSMVSLLALFLLFLGYVVFFMELPEVFYEKTYERTTKIFDRHGELLYEVIPPDSGKKNFVSLDKIPERIQRGTVALEDRNFYSHSGIDVGAILRALWFNVSYREVVSGASTIPQQLVRNILGTERTRTFDVKVYESLLALRMSFVYSKDYILESYLNTIYYGNNAYGIQAASQQYFGKNVWDLDLAESSLLLGLPQAPSRYDPLVNFALAKKRQEAVLDVLLEEGLIDQGQYDDALTQELVFVPKEHGIKAPHFVEYVLADLEASYGHDEVVYGGLEVVTSLDYGIYKNIQEIIDKRLQQLADYNVNNAAVVVLENHTGEVLSFHGSKDYFNDAINGRVAVPFRFRQPGSTLKPFVYLAGFQKNYTPASILYDIETRYFTEEGNPYSPQNYDGEFHGPVSVRESLANSYNVPAVQMMEQVGVHALLHLLGSVGVTVWGGDSPQSLGLALALGDGEVQLLSLANAYRSFPLYGVLNDLRPIVSINDKVKNLSRQKRVFQPQEAYLITHILSDNNARVSSFGEDSFLNLPFDAAAKTGTTRNYNDNWVIGYSPLYTVGVWVGNSNGEAMNNVSGITGAGPIWHDVMLLIHQGRENIEFPQPEGMVRVAVCSVSGLLPTQYCGERRTELFISGTEPTGEDFWWQQTSEGVQIVYPLELREWAEKRGFLVQEGQYIPKLIASPQNGDSFEIDHTVPRELQAIELFSRKPGTWFLNREILGQGRSLVWQLESGNYELRFEAEDGQQDMVRFSVE